MQNYPKRTERAADGRYILRCRHTKGNQVKTERCPLCDRNHYHGDGGQPGPDLGHRVAHCLGQPPAFIHRQRGKRDEWLLRFWKREVSKGYYLRLAD